MKPIMKGSLGTLILSVLLLWPGRAFSAEDIPANCPDLVQIVSTLRADLEKRKPDSSRIQAIETQLQEYVNHREEILLSEKLMEKWAKTFQELRDSLPGPFSGTEGHPLYRLMLLRDKLDLVLKTPHFERTCGASQGLCEWKGLCWETKDKKSLKLLLDMVKGSIQQCQAYEDQTLSPLFFGIVGHQEDLMRNSVAGVEACLEGGRHPSTRHLGGMAPRWRSRAISRA